MNPVYYLEDAQGSVVGLTDAAGTTTRFRYDAFGVARIDSSHVDPATTTPFPASTGGDLRFHGLWLEADTGLYYVRARDYDPGSGTFLSRDPAEGATTAPESYHAYNFADSNPLVYKDPTGRFTVIEMNCVSAGQFSGASFRAGASAYARKKVKDTIAGLIKDAAINQVPAILPVDDLIGISLSEHTRPLSGERYRYQTWRTRNGRRHPVIPDQFW